jgi:hypothetical protein
MIIAEDRPQQQKYKRKARQNWRNLPAEKPSYPLEASDPS